ncbi:universal stress protein [soil metagenome]
MSTLKILVATDYSDASDEALREGDATARAAGASLAVVHVIPNVQAVNPLFPQNNAGSELGMTDLIGKVTALLDERISTITGRDPETVERFVEVGLDYPEIIKRAESYAPSLLFVGSVGRTGLARVLLGSVAEKVVRYAHCPVVVVRKPAGKGVVLAATDMSKASLFAVTVAADQARVRGAKLVVVHAMDFSGASFLGEIGAFFGGMQQAVDVPVVLSAAKSALAGALENLKIEAEVLTLDGSPSTVLHDLALSRGAELVVVGTHGRTGLARLALGSVAESIIRHVTCSVLAVRVHE